MKKLLLTILLFFCLAPLSHAATIGRPMNSLGLIGYYPLDGATTNWVTGQETDVSGTGNTGQLLGGMSTTSSPVVGKIGQALKFAAPGQYVNLGTGINPTSGITYAAWVKADTWTNSSGENGIVVRNNGAGQYSAMMVNSSGKLAFYAGNGSNASYDGTGANTLSTGKWYYLVFTYDSVNGLVGYVNGVVDSTVGSVGALTSTAITTDIGTDPSLPTTRNFTGTIDDVRIYNRALSATEVKALYTAESARLGTGNNSLKTNLVGYWKYDDGSGTSATDASGNGLTATLSGSPLPSWTTSGKINDALTFNGTTAYTTVTSSSITGVTSTLSLAFWVNIPSFTAGTYHPLIDIYSESPSAREWTVGTKLVTGTQRFGVITSTDGTYQAARDFATNAGITTGTWYFVVFTYDSAVGAKIYVNGSLDTSNAQTGTLFAATGVPMVTMHAANTYGDGSGYSAGTVDEVGFWSRALSASEIAALYNSGVGTHYPFASQTVIGHSNLGNSNGLVGYWTMDGSKTNWSTGQETDASGNGNTGQLIAMSTSTSPTIGKVGQALKFNGSNQEIDMGTPSALNITGNAITVSAWVYPTVSDSNNRGVAGDVNNAVTQGYILYDHAGQPTLAIGNGSTHFESATSLAAINTWQMWTGVYDGSNLYIYVNGQSAGTPVATTGNISSSAADFQIAKNGYTGDVPWFLGSIDDVRVYNRALSASEVQALYNATK
jgi:hypothetical protein